MLQDIRTSPELRSLRTVKPKLHVLPSIIMIYVTQKQTRNYDVVAVAVAV